tara:strand:+ start:150 stop:380 length:231 start_codon:yes stop_codon:yes gene_type:complete
MIEVTRTQFETYEFIKHFIRIRSRAPTRAEIAHEFDILPNAAQCRVNQLDSKGLLTIERGTACGIKIKELPMRVAA